MSRSKKRLLWTVVFGLALFLILVIGLFLVQNEAEAHEWYPAECCSGLDCSKVVQAVPVSKTVTLPGPSAHATTMLGMEVTDARGQSVFVPANFPKRESKDNSMHVCVRPIPAVQGGGMRLICIFMPPAM